MQNFINDQFFWAPYLSVYGLRPGLRTGSVQWIKLFQKVETKMFFRSRHVYQTSRLGGSNGTASNILFRNLFSLAEMDVIGKKVIKVGLPV